MIKKLFVLLVAIGSVSVTKAIEAADRPKPLKLAVIAPVLEWDDVPEIKRLTDWMQGHYNLQVTWIQPEHPPMLPERGRTDPPVDRARTGLSPLPPCVPA